MTKKIKILRNATVYTHKVVGVAKPGPTTVTLLEGDERDLKALPTKLTTHTKFDVAVVEGAVELIEGVDFEFI